MRDRLRPPLRLKTVKHEVDATLVDPLLYGENVSMAEHERDADAKSRKAARKDRLSRFEAAHLKIGIMRNRLGGPPPPPRERRPLPPPPLLRREVPASSELSSLEATRVERISV